mgnify:CR=1 FL=1
MPHLESKTKLIMAASVNRYKIQQHIILLWVANALAHSSNPTKYIHELSIIDDFNCRKLSFNKLLIFSYPCLSVRSVGDISIPRIVIYLKFLLSLQSIYI